MTRPSCCAARQRGENQFGNFPADELCMGDGQAPIAVQNQADEQFMKDFVSASNREPKAMRWLDGIMG